MRTRTGLVVASVLLSIAVVVLGCAVGGTTGAGTTTTSRPTATPTPPPHALAWFQTDSAGVGQVWASLNGGTARQITHLTVPSGACVRDDAFVPPIFSPDLRHIVTSWSITSCGDIGPADDLYVVDVSSGAATLIPPDSGGLYFLRERSAGWVDNSTMWFMDQLNLAQATIGGSPTTLARIGTDTGNHQITLMDATLRGHILFYVTETINAITSSSNVEYDYSLHRFDLTSRTTLAGSVNLGSAWDCQCTAHAAYANSGLTPGFDVSPDGSHIVYQRVTPNPSTTSSGVASSQFFYANADGSGASRIASYATAASFAPMQLAPNGATVAVTHALPAPSVFTASVTSPGDRGDPGLTFYTANAGSYPAWNWDGRSFWASTDFISGDLIQFTLGTPAGTVVTPSGHNPWTAIGG
jgi:hypothetical protein